LSRFNNFCAKLEISGNHPQYVWSKKIHFQEKSARSKKFKKPVLKAKMLSRFNSFCAKLEISGNHPQDVWSKKINFQEKSARSKKFKKPLFGRPKY
jgi:hypothetical protein